MAPTVRCVALGVSLFKGAKFATTFTDHAMQCRNDCS